MSFFSYSVFLFSLFISLLSRAATCQVLIQVALLDCLILAVLAAVYCLVRLRLLVLARVMLYPPVPEIVTETHPVARLTLGTLIIPVSAFSPAWRAPNLRQQLLHNISIVLLLCKLLGNDYL